MSDVLWWLINLGTRLDIDIASAFEKGRKKRDQISGKIIFAENDRERTNT